MNFEQEIRTSSVIVRPMIQRLDAIVAPEFREYIVTAASEHNVLIIIDLIHIDFMDSSGLGAMIGCYKAVQSTGGLALCSVHANVQEVLKLTHMDRIFEIYDDVDTCNVRAA